jgi:zinc protease
MIIAAMLAAFVAFGQPQPQPLPNDDAVKVGKLENGLTYYIRHNDKPAQRAEFYLATNVGAFQEADDEEGLAHFLEHMCFNGTKNFPGKALLEWLQSIGAEFGRNINASTGFEQTQYMLNNIPITRESVIDSCLLVLHDYSHFVTCDPAEIDAERGVILEERRGRRNAGWRIFEQSLPYYFAGTPYAKRTLIGQEDQLKNFKYESLTNFYRRWYNPDMQAVIVVGDVDVNQIEEKIKTIFSDVPAPAAPTQKPLYPVAENAEPVIGVLTDPEATSSQIEMLWRRQPMIPVALNNTDVAFQFDLIKAFISTIMNERFGDITARPDAPFLSAGFGVGKLCNTCEATSGNVSFKDGEAVKAFTAFMTEVEKLKRYGFTESEVARAKDNIIQAYEKSAEGAASRKNAEFVRPLLNNFFFNDPYMTPENELQLVQAMCGMLNAQILNQILPMFLQETNVLILYNGPEKEGLANPTKEELAQAYNSVKTAEIAPNVEESTNEPLLDAAALKGSKVKKESKTIYGATQWILKNGVKVTVLPTDYKKDQVNINLTLNGGKTLIATEDLPSFEDNIWTLFLRNTGVSKFSGTALPKMLAGKSASASPFISNLTHGITASSTPKDLETALQLLYLEFVDPRFDENEFQTGIQQIKAILPNIEKDPDFRFQIEKEKVFYDNNPRVLALDAELLDKANIATVERVYRELFKDVAGAEVTIVGNVDLAVLKPLVEKYLGSLPKGKKARSFDQANCISVTKGNIEKMVNLAMQTPKATVHQLYTAYLPVDIKTNVTLDAANYILDMIYTKKIREEQGGTYGVGTSLQGRRRPASRIDVHVLFSTNPESAELLSKIAIDELKKYAENGPTEEQFNMAVENLKKNLPESRINNNYWMNALKHYALYGENYDKLYEEAINSLTANDIKTLLQAILAEGNFIEVTLAPQE